MSDFADGSKESSQSWQTFASAMAASVVHNMFKYPDVIQRWKHYEKPVQGTSTMTGNVYRKSVLFKYVKDTNDIWSENKFKG